LQLTPILEIKHSYSNKDHKKYIKKTEIRHLSMGKGHERNFARDVL